jgi:hypothetical protein
MKNLITQSCPIVQLASCMDHSLAETLTIRNQNKISEYYKLSETLTIRNQNKISENNRSSQCSKSAKP